MKVWDWSRSSTDEACQRFTRAHAAQVLQLVLEAPQSSFSRSTRATQPQPRQVHLLIAWPLDAAWGAISSPLITVIFDSVYSAPNHSSPLGPGPSCHYYT